VKAQHGKHARKKDTKSVEEIHSHISLQNPHFAIASKGEESLEIGSLKKGWLALKLKIWCSTGMVTQASAALDLSMVERLVHPHLTLHHLTPLLRLILKMMKKIKKARMKVKTMNEAY
jgi:hypothetical protein